MEVSVRWIPNHASHGFFGLGQKTRVANKVFAVGWNAKKVASHAVDDIFSGRQASKMEFRLICTNLRTA